MKGVTSKEYTKEDIINNLFKDIHSRIESYSSKKMNISKSGKIEGKAVATDVLAAIEGIHSGLPFFDMIDTSDGRNITPELHSMLIDSPEKRRALKLEGRISPIADAFLQKVDGLVAFYDKGGIESPDELVASIFELIDKGVDGKKFELNAVGTKEEQKYAIENGDDYYPVEGVNIAGSLAAQYRERFVPEKSKEESSEARDCVKNMPKGKNISIRDVIKNAVRNRITKFDEMTAKLAGTKEKIVGGDGKDVK